MPWSDYPRYYEIQKLWDEGVRARDWPLPAILELIKNPETDYLRYQYRLTAYYAYLDRRMFSEAEDQIVYAQHEVLKHSWESYDHVVRIKLELAFILAFQRKDLDEVDRLLTDVDYPLDELESSKERVLAAKHAARGELEAARTRVGRATRMILQANSEIKPNIQAELDWLQWVLETAA